MPVAVQARPCACGGSCPRCRAAVPVQPKPDVGLPDDAYERDADRVADQIMRTPDLEKEAEALPIRRHITPRVQRQADVEEDEGEEPIQLMRVRSEASSEPAHPADGIRSMQGRGQPLARSIRSFFEPRLGSDRSQVRVHTDARAAESAQAMNAQAYTMGREIVFAEGRYAPHTIEGRRLLAHELVHVIQQAGANSSPHSWGPRVTPSTSMRLMRKTYAGCSKAFAKVSNPGAVMDAARAAAPRKVHSVIGSLQKLNSRTIRQLDRHFHCPSISQIRKIIAIVGRIKSSLPGLAMSCGDPACTGTLSGVLQGSTVHLCAHFFQRDADIQAGVLIDAAARRIGLGSHCTVRDSCYDDFTKDASDMIDNSYSFAYLALEATGYSLPQPATIPCRPFNTGFNVVVPPDAAKHPSKIRLLSGFSTKSRGSVIVPVFRDAAGNYFIYYDGLPGARVYLPGEKPRFYFPEGRLPPSS